MKLKTIVMIIGTVPAIIGVVQIYGWIVKPEYKLVAQVNYGSFSLPPQLNTEYEKIAELVSEKHLKELIVKDKLENRWRWDSLSGDTNVLSRDANVAVTHIRPDANDLVHILSMTLTTEISYKILSECELFKGYWKVFVTNEGSKKVSEVLLTLPDAKYAQITADGKQTKLIEGSRLELGELQPKDVVEIYAWTNIANLKYFASDIKLTHNAGVGNIEVYHPLGRLIQIIDYWWGISFIIILLILLLVFLEYLKIKLREPKDKKESVQ
jgi:hypothetical protein